MVPMHPGKFLKVLEFFTLSRVWKVLEINVCSGKLWKFNVRVMETLNLLCFKFDKFALCFVWVQLKNYGDYLSAYRDIMHH